MSAPRDECMYCGQPIWGLLLPQDLGGNYWSHWPDDYAERVRAQRLLSSSYMSRSRRHCGGDRNAPLATPKGHWPVGVPTEETA